MMKYMLTATALVLILMVMWLPARTPPEIFEETALREALMLRTGEGIPMPETAANLAVEYLDGLVWVSGVPDRYTLRPYGGSPMTKDEFAEIGRAAERTTQTEWLRAMKSLFVMATQRLAVMTAGTIALMPFILALIVDGFVRRRIREAEYHVPSPTWWTCLLYTSSLGFQPTARLRALKASVPFGGSRSIASMSRTRGQWPSVSSTVRPSPLTNRTTGRTECRLMTTPVSSIEPSFAPLRPGSYRAAREAEDPVIRTWRMGEARM